jgi:hypothetical protein
MSPADNDDLLWTTGAGDPDAAPYLAADSNKPAPAAACKTDFSHRQDFDL